MKTVDLSAWDVTNSNEFNNIFAYCSSLEYVNVSGWNVQPDSWFIGMFGGCNSLKEIEGLEDWSVSGHIHISNMFEDCSELKQLDLSKWSGEVTLFSGVVKNCSSLEYLDIRNITVNYDEAEQHESSYPKKIFDGCENLKEVYLNSSAKQYLESDKYEGYVPDCIIYVD